MQSEQQVDTVVEDEISLIDLLNVLASHWKMIVKVPIVVAVVAALVSLYVPNQYTAKTIILPTDDKAGVMNSMMAQLGGMAGLAGGALGGATKADLYVTILKSETLKDQLIENNKLMSRFGIEKRTVAYNMIDGLTQVVSGKKDGVITIAVTTKDPKLSSELANSYVQELGNIVMSLEMTGAAKNKFFLEKQLTAARVDLVKAEDDVKSFQSKHKAISLPDQAKASIEGVAQLRAQLAVQEVQLGALQRQFTDRSQEVKSAKATIAQIRNQIGSLEGKGGGSLPSIGSIPALGQEYIRLMREFKIQEAIVEMLTKQYELSKVNSQKDISPFQVIQAAKVPEVKSKPKRSTIVVLSGITAGFCMVLLAFIMTAFKNTDPKTRDKLRDVCQMLPPIPERIKKPCQKVWVYLS